MYARVFNAGPPRLRISDASIDEGDGPGTAAVGFDVTIDATNTVPVTVQWTLADGDGPYPAVAGADYTPASGTVMFAPGTGQRTQRIIATIVRDVAEEPAEETFLVNLSNPVNVVIADGRGVGTIVDDDPKIGFFGPNNLHRRIDRWEAAGGAAGNVYDFIVTLSAPSARAVTVDYATRGFTAHDGSAAAQGPADFRPLAGRLTFLPGETTKTIPVLVIGDNVFESNETFFVDLSNPVGATLGGGANVASGVIRNQFTFTSREGLVTTYDDAPPVASVSDATGLEGGGWMEFVVTLDRPSYYTATSLYELVAGTATAGTDFTLPNANNRGTVSFSPYTTSTTVRVPLPNDLALEPNETFTLRLFADPAGQQYANPTTQVPIGDAEGVGTIEDNDGARGPRVTAVFVNGTGWAPQFRSAVAPGDRVDSTFGYRVPAGAEQLNELPWVNLDQVGVRFDMDVRVEQGDLTLLGSNGTPVRFANFRYDAQNRTAVWTLPVGTTLGNDRYTLVLSGGRDGVVGADTGNFLDGEWADGADAFPSGDGTAGGDFRFGLNVLPGDVNRNGFVSSTDFGELQARSRFHRTASRPGTGPYAYTPFHDVNGDGIITNADLTSVYARMGRALPAPAPAPLPLAAPTATDDVFSQTPVLA